MFAGRSRHALFYLFTYAIVAGDNGRHTLRLYLIHKLTYDAVPFASVEVVHAVFAVWYKGYAVLEAHHGSNLT